MARTNRIFAGNYTFDRIDEGKNNPIDIDFSNVLEIESSSLNIILIKLIKSFSTIENRDWDIKLSNNDEVNRGLVNLGFIDMLKRNIPNNKLFLQSVYLENKIGGDFKNENSSNSPGNCLPC
ncbi:MAG: hypothetical protein IPP93_00020 [Chitinophagaceae bacterium]|nr:hypothetical protein [Chitinophagaceae bacterium]